MTGIELPLYAALGVISMVAGAGGSYAVTKKAAKRNSEDIQDYRDRLIEHEKDDARAFQEIMRALGRIEGNLQEMTRSKT